MSSESQPVTPLRYSACHCESPERAPFHSQHPRPADVGQGKAFDPWNLRILPLDEFEALGHSDAKLSQPQLEYLCSFGSLAPTTHNTVPQRFRFDAAGMGLGVWLDRQYVLPESDARGRQATISCGCAVTYLTLAAAAYGWRAAVRVCAADPDAVMPLVAGQARYVELARLTLGRLAGRNQDLRWLRAMLDRRSLRTDYDPRVELESDLVQEMRSLVAQYPGLRMHLLTDSITLAMLGRFQELADTTVYNREDFARELGHWLLENDDDASLGMRGSEFGLSDEAARHFHHGLRGEEQLLPDEVAALAKSVNTAIRSASAVVVLCVETDDTVSRLNAGRAFAELMLLLQLRDMFTAVHAAITEVESPNMALRGRLRTGWRPVVVFRVGRPARTSDRGRPHSARPPASDLILNEVIGAKPDARRSRLEDE